MDSKASPSTGMINFLTWIEVNKKRLLIGGVAGVVVIFLLILFIRHEAQKEVVASQALSDVRVPFSAASPMPEGTADALLKVANEYRGTKAAARALLLSAGVSFAQNNEAGYNEAQRRFTQLLRDYPESPWVSEASLGVAASLAALGKTNDAIQKYEEFRKRFATAPTIDEAKLALARLYEPQKPDEAFRIYDELAKSGMAGMAGGGGMGSGAAMEANMRMNELMKERPELAKLRESLNPPPPSAPPPPQTITLTNRLSATGSNAARSLGTNVPRIVMTNRSPAAAGQPVEIKLSPQPSPQPPPPSK